MTVTDNISIKNSVVSFLRLLLLCHFILWQTFSFCQNKTSFTTSLNFKNIGTKDGLSQRSVVTIAQDNQGFLWFGTRYGLNKFNGSEFQVYNYNSNNEKSLSHNRITALKVDTKGQLWIGTESGLNLYNPNEDNFVRLKISNKANKYYTKSIRDIVPIDSTALWIASSNGLDKINPKTGELFNISTYLKGQLGSNDVTSIIQGENSTLWICNSENIQVFDIKANTLKTYTYPNNFSPNITKNFTTELYKDHENNIWLGYNGGLAFFNKITKAFEDYTLNSKKAIKSPVRSIYQDKDNLFWIGSYEGLHELNLERKSIRKYEHNVNDPQSLSQNSVYSIIEDARGDLWAGTWAGGVNYIDRNSNNFRTFTVGSSSKHLNYKVVSSIVEDANENLWIGTEGGGLNFYDAQEQTFKFFKQNSNNPKSLNTNNIKTIALNHEGNLWIGTHGEGLSLFKLKNNVNRFTYFKSLNNIYDNKITSLLEDDNHNIWIGTNKGGLSFFDVALKKLSKIKDPNEILGGNSISVITKSNNKSYIYVGGQNGLAKININERQLRKINFKKTPENLPFTVNKVISLLETDEHTLWIGTEGDGLYNYDLTTGSSTSYGIKDGLPNEVIYGILSDDKNNIWISTNKGISRINTSTKEVKNFDESDGLQGNEFNYGAYLKTKKGNLVFGGTSGFTIINPDHIIEKNSYIPPIEITAFKVRNKPFLKRVDALNTINLAHNQNDFSFDFVALGFAHPKKHQYSYKLEGFDSDWNYVGNQKTATYTNLNPGDYEFLVKASNGYGVWSELPKKVYINIKTPYWKTWWAYLGYIIILSTITLTIRRYYLLRVKDKRELKQEREDREKVEEVNRLKLQLFTNISHDFRTPLTLIIGPLKRLIDKNEGNGHLQNQLTGMYRNANILLQLINQLLDFRKSEAGKLKLSIGKRDIISFLENIKLSFDELANERNIDYNFISDKTFFEMWFDEIEMKKVILNILSNAFKFTPSGGKITLGVAIKSNSEELEIIIEDNGKGIRKEDLPNVFDRYFQLGQHHELRSGTGVGLALAKDIVLLHKGEVLAESEKGSGTKFTILLPTGKSHFKKEQFITTNEDLDISVVQNPSIVNIGWVNEEDEIKDITIDNNLPSILHVEDNKEVRQFIRDIFSEAYNVFEAENGERGISIAQTNTIDLIISDVMMPKMDGLEFCNTIKSNLTTSHIPVLLLTARSSTKAQRNGFNKGADVYVTKPFDADLLKMQVKNLLNSRKTLIEKFRKNILLEPKELELESPDEAFLKKVMTIVEENLSESTFMASTLIEKVHMSQSVLYRKLKALTGQSISEFIRTIRLKRASQLLVKSNMGVAEIAYEVGFNDLKYFRRCFKKTFDVTPSEYRKKTFNQPVNTN
ncbi:hybrid sensor histidine kinase/response regulator transcription factor [Seonamhaeicola marinus]|uniref:histidine kinase n=1 Tax=Seonamhaeicola marinus TaxID=1912246 RepID=A0A5D0HX04_9FLAO|nr:hybrid sensor histidine kinase/response regulator transcription factor [Seonamhaeicola marinus]TYA74667.1 response regulator [Seonamhaeicola marinus]